MASSLDISFSNDVFTIMRGTQTIGRGRTLETAISNAINGDFEPADVFMAAEVIQNMIGPLKSSHGQIATREP